MPKRSSVECSSAPSGKAKAAKKAEHSSEIPQGIEVLSQVSNLSNASQQMLKAAAPYCMSEKGDRHEYQNHIAELMLSMLSDEKTFREKAIRSLEEQLSGECASRLAKNSELSIANTQVTEQQAAKEAGEEGLKAATAAVAEAEAVVEAKKTHEASLDGERQAVLNAQDSHKKTLAELWEPLKSCSFPSGQWRQRNKAAAQVVEEAGRLGAPPSLQDALPAALKTKCAERGRFALIVIEHTEKLFSEKMASLEAQMASFEGMMDVRAKATADAKEALETARVHERDAMKRSVDADNAWMDALTKAGQIEAAEKDCAKRVSALERELAAANERLMEFVAAATRFTETMTGVSAAAPVETSAQVTATSEDAGQAALETVAEAAATGAATPCK